MSQMTSGRLMASHIRVRFDGVCDHLGRSRVGADEAELRILIGVCGGEKALVGAV